ncbi:Putative HMP/thiamine permease protein ykoE [Dermatophilus congolensis]|uniref:Putative HMP/thiamine permease protein ykoE n=1 Tax=Dermatophilus congolensis TaxID=1863 RepID=A0A239VH87_9MICO|nr:ECF transporter S component [Dermatophilus congolensis]SNV21129.1 Putative HMP/thiamine permease protein ykoE [Dermatophilus congolensis]
MAVGTETSRSGDERACFAVARGGPAAWRGLDFVTLAMLGVAFGVAFWAWDVLLYPFVKLALVFPPLMSLTLGVWLLPCVVGMLIVRRPGAAVFIECIAAFVEMALGNEWGAMVMVSATLQGLGVEAAFALFRWRRAGLSVAILGGFLAAVAEIAGYEWWVYQVEYAWVWRFVSLGAAAVSGVFIAGCGGWSIMRALASTGALRALPAGRDALQQPGSDGRR